MVSSCLYLSFSDYLVCIIFSSLSTLTELTTNFGIGVLPLGLYMTPTCWGLPKPVLTGRNARLVKTFNNFSYRLQYLRTNDIDINFVKGITNCIKYCLHCSLLLLQSGDIETNPGSVSVITEITINPHNDPQNPIYDLQNPDQDDNKNSTHTVVEFTDIAQVTHLINTYIKVVTNRDNSIDGLLLKIESNKDIGYILMENVNYKNKYANSMQINLNQVVTMRPYQPLTTI